MPASNEEILIEYLRTDLEQARGRIMELIAVSNSLVKKIMKLENKIKSTLDCADESDMRKELEADIDE